MKNVFQKGIVHAVRAIKRHVLHLDIDSQRLLETDTDTQLHIYFFPPLVVKIQLSVCCISV